MINIILNIKKELRDGSIKEECALLDTDRNLIETQDSGTDYRIDKIDYKHGTIIASNYENKERVFIAGETYDIGDKYSNKSLSFEMEDDGIPCSEDTLELFIRCYETAKGLEQETSIPYSVGSSIILTPHPYQITVLETNDEEVLIEIKDEDKTTKYLVQLNNRVERNDEYGYATGSPNDPYDTHGPSVYVYLVRK